MPEPQPKPKRGGGPRTPEGKARSSLNALKHGLSARKVVLKCESQEEFDELLAGLTEAWQPVDTMEAAIVADMAAARWRLQRIWSVETTVIDLEMTDQEEAVEDKFEYADGETRAALAMKALCSDSGAFALISRYEARHRRAFDRALSNLLRLRKARREEKAEHGPEPPPEPASAQKKVNERTDAPAAAAESGGAAPASAGPGCVACPVPQPVATARHDAQVPFLQNELAAAPATSLIQRSWARNGGGPATPRRLGSTFTGVLSETSDYAGPAAKQAPDAGSTEPRPVGSGCLLCAPSASSASPQ